MIIAVVFGIAAVVAVASWVAIALDVIHPVHLGEFDDIAALEQAGRARAALGRATTRSNR